MTTISTVPTAANSPEEVKHPIILSKEMLTPQRLPHRRPFSEISPPRSRADLLNREAADELEELQIKRKLSGLTSMAAIRQEQLQKVREKTKAIFKTCKRTSPAEKPLTSGGKEKVSKIKRLGVRK